VSLTSEIITFAHRETNLVAKGQAPSAEHVAEALPRLNSLVSAAYGYEVGRQFIDWPVGQQGISAEDQTYWSANEWQFPPANVRLIAASDSAQTIYLHPQPSDGARVALIDPAGLLASAPITIDGNGRRIEGVASVVPTVNTIWFYRADQGNWVVLSALTAVDPEEFPFPIEFDDYFVIMLAARINPRYGRSLSEASTAILGATLEKLRARYRQAALVPGERALAALTSGFGDGCSQSANGDTGHLGQRRLVRPPHYEG